MVDTFEKVSETLVKRISQTEDTFIRKNLEDEKAKLELRLIELNNLLDVFK